MHYVCIKSAFLGPQINIVMQSKKLNKSLEIEDQITNLNVNKEDLKQKMILIVSNMLQQLESKNINIKESSQSSDKVYNRISKKKIENNVSKRIM